MGKARNHRWWGIAGIVVIGALVGGCKRDSEDGKGAARESITQALKQTGELLSSATRTEPFIRLSYCFVDFNGDDVLDIAGLSTMGENGPAVVLDGRNGATLWSGGDYRYGAIVICPDTSAFIVNDRDSWDISLRSARNPGVEKIVRLSDKPAEFGSGQGCLAIQTEDQRFHGISLADGANVPCKAKSMKTSHHLTMERNITSPPWHLQAGRTDYEVSVRSPGTPLILLKARGEYSWGADLPYYDDKPPFALATEELLLVAGRRVSTGEKSSIFLVGVDRKTGAIRYEQPLCARNMGLFNMRRNGSTVLLLEGWSGLWAFDILTGRRQWQAGRCEH